MRSFIKKIQNTIFQQRLFKRDAKVVLAVSGGPDSVCLLDVFAKLTPKYDLELLIAHVNYGLRGKDSDKDEKFVRRLAKKHRIKINILKVTRIKPSENELRNIRYNFFEKVRKENNFDLIAVAHNMDDQVETFLMRLIRGSGLSGLSAMKHKAGTIIRPLLGISRKEILEYLNRTNRTYRTDRTNKQNLFLRNKIRNELVPYLEKNYNPKIRQTIFDATASIADDYSFLTEYAGKLIKNQKTLSVKKLLELHPALQKRLLLKYIAAKKFNLKDIESSHIEEILKALKSTKGKRQIVIFKGLKLTRVGDRVIIITHNT